MFPEWLQFPVCGGRRSMLESERKVPAGCCVLSGQRVLTLARCVGRTTEFVPSLPRALMFEQPTQPGPAHGVEASAWRLIWGLRASPDPADKACRPSGFYSSDTCFKSPWPSSYLR